MANTGVVDSINGQEGGHSVRRRLVQDVFSPRFGVFLFAFGLFLYYVAIPLVLYFSGGGKETYLLLAHTGLVAISSLALGYLSPLTDSRFRAGSVRLVVDGRLFNGALWSFSLVFMVLVLYSAPAIPLLSAFAGSSADVLSQERGDFLKAREGLEIVFLYVTAILTSSLLPYSLTLLYATKNRYRHPCAVVFLLFCISFLQKALFLNLVLPLLVYFGMAGFVTRGRLALYLLLASGGLLAGTIASIDGPVWTFQGFKSIDEVFAADYPYGGAFAYFLWRALAVPIFTANDMLFVFLDRFGGEEFLGGTSGLLSAVFQMERINIERHVFEYQFGSWNEIANANAVFFVDAFVNFGWLGVIVFSLIVGQVFRMFTLSQDPGFKALWPLFGFVLFSAPLIGMLFSNGFVYMILHGLFVAVRPDGSGTREPKI
jgi:hypothetical protein